MTFVGITATDAWNAARYQCSFESGVKDLTIKEFVECICSDLWSKDWDRDNAVDIDCMSEPEFDDNSLSGEGIEVALHDYDNNGGVRGSHSSYGSRGSSRLHNQNQKAKKEFAQSHQLIRTTQKESGNRSAILRRACSIRATGCQCMEQGTRKKTSMECAHPDCMAATQKKNNNYSRGVFICQNKLCLKEHLRKMWAQHEAEQFNESFGSLF